MKIITADIYALQIPFVTSFRHYLGTRDYCDSIVVKLTTDTGIVGWGEGVPRPYVTGETPVSCVQHIKSHLLAKLLGFDLFTIDPHDPWEHFDILLPDLQNEKGIVWHASRCAVELALLDCLYRCFHQSFHTILPPISDKVTYSAVIGAGDSAKTEALAQRFKEAGFQHVKMKVSKLED
ncbi:MAG: hypothetical protein MI892_09930, partial [Desulfobacterales bacterium]|nr:hypothetical protein [Desulfobacterales bacterium]